MKLITIIFGFFFAACMLINGSFAKSSCHLRELDYCSVPVVLFVQSASQSDSPLDIDVFCGNLNETNSCLSSFFKRCSSSKQRALFDFFASGPRNVSKNLCNKESTLRKDLDEKLPCLSSHRSKAMVCVRTLRQSLESIEDKMKRRSSDSHDTEIGVAGRGCCAINQFRTCITTNVSKNCGNETATFLNDIEVSLFTRLPKIMCENFDVETCKDAFPSIGHVSSDRKSKGAIGKVFKLILGDNA